MKYSRFMKPLNVLKSGYSYLLSRTIRTSVISGMPVSVGIEISGQCNLRCPECSSGSGLLTRPKGLMDIELFARIITELRTYLYNINMYFQGEPMLHPRFFDFLEIMRGLRVTVSTNGHFLSGVNSEKLARSGLNKIIVSLDGMDDKTYSLYRQGGDQVKVSGGIRNVSDAIERTGSHLKLEIQFLVHRHNQDQITSIARFAKEVNAALRLKSMQILNPERIEYWLPDDDKFRRYKKVNNGYAVKNRSLNGCLRLWLNPVITWDGKVLPCCFDKNADHIMGDLIISSFKNIWHGDRYRSFRDSVLTRPKSIGICRNCTSGLYRVKY
jgi:MoaA/NifB/PqqE/SkfB family radical SAM enzyme